jgi:hypothetical protein
MAAWILMAQPAGFLIADADASRGVNDPRDGAGPCRAYKGGVVHATALCYNRSPWLPDGRQRAPPYCRTVHVAVVAFPAKRVPVVVALLAVAVMINVWLGTTSITQVVPSFGRGWRCSRDAEQVAELKVLAVQRDEFHTSATELEMVAQRV